MNKELTIEQIALVAHEANRAYCRVLGDDSQLSWDQAPDWQKESAVLGVQNILKNPSLTPEQSHQLWVQHKNAHGWTWGPTKNVAAKTHPCLRPYHSLPIEQKVKDLLFGVIVRTLDPDCPSVLPSVDGPHEAGPAPEVTCAPDTSPAPGEEAPQEEAKPEKPQDKCGPGGKGDVTCCPS